MAQMTVKQIVQEISKFLFLCAWEIPDKMSLTARAAERILPALNEALTHQQGHSQSTSKPATVQHVEAIPQSSTAPVNGAAEPSLGQLKEMIKNELGSSITNMQDLIKEALENLNDDEQAKVNEISTTKDKAILIAKLFHLL